MDGFKLCSDGVHVIPADFPCPPPYSGPSYSVSEDINLSYPPPQYGSDGAINITTTSSSPQGSSSAISAGAIAGIVLVIVAFFCAMICVFAIKFGTRLPFVRSPLSRPRSLQRQQSGYGDVQGLNGNEVMVDFVSISRGLDEKLVRLLPVSEYVSGHHGNTEGKVTYTTECAVCLSSFNEKDIVRVLPKCHHTFHICCIDRWFESHANCPLCRETITLQSLVQLSDMAPHQSVGENGHELNYNTQGHDCPEDNDHANHLTVSDVCQDGDHNSADPAVICYDNAEPNQEEHAQEVFDTFPCILGRVNFCQNGPPFAKATAGVTTHHGCQSASISPATVVICSKTVSAPSSNPILRPQSPHGDTSDGVLNRDPNGDVNHHMWKLKSMQASSTRLKKSRSTGSVTNSTCGYLQASKYISGKF